jgi:hypothetical protein
MSKISNTSAYPTTAPAGGDLLIGTDINDSDATKTFTISSVVALTPDNTLAEVLTAGNTATNNIILTGDITCTNIIPTNIKDSLGLAGTAGQHLVKNAANALEWGTGSADTLANVLAAGNSATTYIALSGPTGYLTATYVAPVDIKDNGGSLGAAGQSLMKSAANALEWGTPAANTLQEVLTAGNTAIEDINLTGDLNLTGGITGTGNITRSGTISATGTITSDVDIQAGTTVSASSYKGTSIPAFGDDAAAGVGGLVAGDFFQSDGTSVNGPADGTGTGLAGVLMVKQ